MKFIIGVREIWERKFIVRGRTMKEAKKAFLNDKENSEFYKQGKVLPTLNLNFIGYDVPKTWTIRKDNPQ